MIINSYDIISFTDLSYIQKAMILRWRNDISIRKWMYNNEPINISEHLNFIQNLETKKFDKYFLVSKGYNNIGIIYLNNINYEKKSAALGLYKNPFLQRGGYGTILLELLIHYSFHYLFLQNLKLEVFEKNQKAIKLYKKFGFSIIKKDDNTIFMQLKKSEYEKIDKT